MAPRIRSVRSTFAGWGLGRVATQVVRRDGDRKGAIMDNGELAGRAARVKAALIAELEKLDDYSVCGFVDRARSVYPLGSDTKVLSTVFEMICRPAVYAVGASLAHEIVEPSMQNHYPDFTMMQDKEDSRKIAIDVKTTYRRSGSDKFRYTLGGYTSFIRPGNERKNIVFPFYEYATHLVIGFVYSRIERKKAEMNVKYDVNRIEDVPIPFADVEFFVQDKWRISSDRAGSGNTTNIGSINGAIDDFRKGNGPFESEREFLDYWSSYGRTASSRTEFSDIDGFRRLARKRITGDG